MGRTWLAQRRLANCVHFLRWALERDALLRAESATEFCFE